MSGEHILLVDDDPDLRRIALMSLTRVGGWEAEGAASGQEAVDKAKGARPALIILDAMMPRLDGLATLERLRSEPELVDVPVIFMTAKVQRADVDEYLAAGAIGVIPKPFDPMTLPDQLKKIVGRAGKAIL
jgi:CheY-like chemotaxis protein